MPVLQIQQWFFLAVAPSTEILPVLQELSHCHVCLGMGAVLLSATVRYCCSAATWGETGTTQPFTFSIAVVCNSRRAYYTVMLHSSLGILISFVIVRGQYKFLENIAGKPVYNQSNRHQPINSLLKLIHYMYIIGSNLSPLVGKFQRS